jgi:hypothetical protein
MRSGGSRFRPTPKVYWQAFLDWLARGVWGVLPDTLFREVGQVERLLPLVRSVALALEPWLLSLPSEPLDEGSAALRRQIAADVEARPLKQGEVALALADLSGVLAVELIRLPRLLRAPWSCFPPCAWSGCVAREWAFVISLVRIGQAYFALEGLFGGEVAEQVWRQQVQQAEELLARWRAATTPAA